MKSENVSFSIFYTRQQQCKESLNIYIQLHYYVISQYSENEALHPVPWNLHGIEIGL